MNTLKNRLLVTAFAGVLSLGASQTSFGQNLIQNGNFTTLTNIDGVTPNTTGGHLGNDVQATGWATTGYNFVYPNPNPGSTAVSGVGLYSTYADGSSNGLSLPPLGGNVVAADGAYQTAPLSQNVTGLVVNNQYALSFYYGAGQQAGFTGPTTESWSVALGGAGYSGGVLSGAQTTPTINNPARGFTGWLQQTFTFTATSSSETLYFLANGTPNGQPPFSLLGNVSMTAVPEASTYWTILLTMAIMVGTVIRRRTRAMVPAKA